MADQTTKVFTIELQGKTDTLEKQLQAAQKAAEAVGGELTKGFSKTNNQLGMTKTVLTLVTKELQAAQEISAKLNRELGKAGTNLFVFKNGSIEIEKTLRGVTAVYENETQKQLAFAKEKAAKQLAFAKEQAFYAKERVKEQKRLAKEAADWEIEQGRRAIAERKQLENQLASIDAARIAAKRADSIAAFQPPAAQVNASSVTPVKPTSGRFNYATGALLPEPKPLDPAVESSYRSFFTRVFEGITIYKAFNAVLHLTEQALLSIPRAGIALEGTTATLTSVFESEAMAAKQMVFLRNEAERTGISLSQLRDSYKTFAASALLAGESVDTVNDIFKNINTIATTLHLSADQVNGVFLAFSQMFNKGKIQAEELTKQLSQVLPGITNQAAKALAISVADMQKQMQAGTLTAHESVQKIAEQVGKAFGGEGFDKATQGLQANLGRLSTAWTTLAENIYKDSDGILVSVVRMATGTVEGLAGISYNAASVKDTFNQVSGTIMASVGIYAGAKAAQVAYALTLSRTAAETFRLGTATTALSGLLSKSIFGAAILALGTFIGKLYAAKEASSELTASVDELVKKKQAQESGQSSQYTAENDPEVKRIKAIMTAQEERVKNLQANVDYSKGQTQTPNRSLVARLEEETKRLEQVRTSYKQEYDKVLNDLQPSISSTGTAAPNTQESDAKVEAELAQYTEGAITGAKERVLYRFRKDIAKYQAAIETGKKIIEEADTALAKEGKLDVGANIDSRKAGQETIANAEQKLKEIQQIAEGAAGKVASKGAKQDLIASYKDTTAEFTRMRESITGGLAELDAAYANNETTISQYFVSKKALMDQDYALQLQQRDAEIQQAFAAKDTVKIAQLQVEKSKIQNEQRRADIELTRQQTAAEREYVREVSALEAQYLQFKGKTKEAAIVNFETQNKHLIEVTQQEVEAGKASAIAVRDKINATRDLIGMQAELQDSNQKSQIISDQLANKELQIQAAQRVGAITELDALHQIQAAREEYIKQQEEIVSANERLVASGDVRDSHMIQQVKNARAQLEAFKLEADLMGQKFQTIFTQNFSNGFQAFATGAANARQAFNIFAKGVIANLAEIASQQAAQGILSLVIKGIGSIANSYSGSGVDAFGANASGRIMPAANGHIVSGISSASSTILDKPTLFPGAKVIPFASGGVLAGEAGKEGVLPLKRIGDRLGVSAEGLSGGGNTVVIQNLTVQIVEKKGSTADEQAALVGQQVKQQVQVLIDQKFARESRPGGMLAAKR